MHTLHPRLRLSSGPGAAPQPPDDGLEAGVKVSAAEGKQQGAVTPGSPLNKDALRIHSAIKVRSKQLRNVVGRLTTLKGAVPRFGKFVFFLRVRTLHSHEGMMISFE